MRNKAVSIMLLCGILSILVSAGVSATGQVPFFSQQDPKWADKPLDDSPYTIGERGCALTSAAMVVKYYGVETDPNKLNGDLTDIGAIDSGGDLDWVRVPEVCNGKVTWIGRVDEPDWDRVDCELAQSYLVIAEVTATGHPQHFIVFIDKAVGDYYFYDSGSSEEVVRTWPTSYNDICYSLVGLRIYHGTLSTNIWYVNGTCGDDSWSGLEPNCIGPNGPKKTVQAAIDVASDGDTVLVADGIYTGSDNKNLYWDGNEKHIMVKSENGPDNCIIDCNNNGIGFYFPDTNQIDADVIDGFTIKNGDYTEGGGIYCYNSSPTIINCIITGNIANYGGGIYCDNSCPTITNCKIMGTVATLDGGGIYCDNSSPAITNCSITGNTATYWGGGIYCNYSSSPTITNCTITGNITNQWDGGGIYCLNSSSPEVNNCIIAGNTANDDGGGIYCGHYSSPTITNCTIGGNAATGYYSDGGAISCHDYSSPAITNCTIVGNATTGSYSDGGGISCHDYSSPAITNCTITGNATNDSGGGIYCYYYSSATITNCTISGNTAENYGGGICCYYYSSATIVNSILWNDSAAEGREVALQSADNPSTLSISYSDVDGGRADIYRETGCYLDWDYDSNIKLDPLFVRDPNDGGDGWRDDPATPDVNEGANDDFGDLHLLPSSPCIDAGDNTTVPPGVTTDLDGHPRIADGDCNDTDIVDMGAYEFGWAYIGDFDCDCDVDFGDYAVFASEWMDVDCNSPDWCYGCDLNKSGSVDLFDLAELAEHWLVGR